MIVYQACLSIHKIYKYKIFIYKKYSNISEKKNNLTTHDNQSVLLTKRAPKSRVVNVETSWKMCQRDFGPTPHTGTLEIVPAL